MLGKSKELEIVDRELLGIDSPFSWFTNRGQQGAMGSKENWLHTDLG